MKVMVKYEKSSTENNKANWHSLGVEGLEKVINALNNPLRAVKQPNGRYGFVVEQIQVTCKIVPLPTILDVCDIRNNLL